MKSASAQAAVALGETDLGPEGERAVTAEPERGGQVVVPLLLAGVAAHRLRQLPLLGGDVDQEVGVGGVVDLVEEDPRLAQLAVAQRRQHPVEGGEGGAVVGGDLQRRGGEEELGTLGQERPADTALGLLQPQVELAVGEPEVVAAGEPERAAGAGGLLPPAPPVLLALRRLMAAAAAVGQEEDAHHRPGGGELRHEAAAAEHLVVVMGRQDQGAPGGDALGPAGGQEEALAHWM